MGFELVAPSRPFEGGLVLALFRTGRRTIFFFPPFSERYFTTVSDYDLVLYACFFFIFL